MLLYLLKFSVCLTLAFFSIYLYPYCCVIPSIPVLCLLPSPSSYWGLAFGFACQCQSNAIMSPLIWRRVYFPCPWSTLDFFLHKTCTCMSVIHTDTPFGMFKRFPILQNASLQNSPKLQAPLCWVLIICQLFQALFSYSAACLHGTLSKLVSLETATFRALLHVTLWAA